MPYSLPKYVASMTRTTGRGRCIFSGNSAASRSFVIVRGVSSTSSPSCSLVRFPRTYSSQRARTRPAERRVPLDERRHAIQRYRTTPPLVPFLTTERAPQNQHFFSHVLQV